MQFSRARFERTIVVVVGLVALTLPSLTRERPAAQAAPSTRPNIVTILTDDQTIATLASMPYVSSHPGGRWVEFPNNFVNTPLCCPSRATFLTGQYAHNSYVTSNTAGERMNEAASLAPRLQAAGYRTGFHGKYLNLYPFGRDNPGVPGANDNVPLGWDEWGAFIDEPSAYDFPFNRNGATRGYSRPVHSTQLVGDLAAQFVSSAQQPFFSVVAPYAPHVPAEVPPSYDAARASYQIPVSPSFNEADVTDKPSWIRQRRPLTAQQQQRVRATERQMYTSLAVVDDLVRKIYGALQARGVLDNTLLVFTSDNGWVAGQHRYEKKSCVYEECVNVPLLVRYPSGPTQHRVDEHLVSNVDLAPTFLHLAGASPAAPQDGRSLVPLLEGTPPSQWRAGVLLEMPYGNLGAPAFWGVRTREWKYVEIAGGEKELYDLARDPYEERNIACRPGGGCAPAVAQRQAELSNLLQQLRR